ncbi:MAG: hypothetical protein NXH95_05260 [Pseudomonadaceae bacterium]|nr:hypothetical protein [Pseudomonadaceae bacterium]
MNPLTYLAMALDTLPDFGRVLLLAFLLTLVLYGFTRLLPGQMGSTLQVLYRKGALLALIGVPLCVYLFNVQVPVPVDEFRAFSTPVPGHAASVLLLIWLLGVAYHANKAFKIMSQTRAAAQQYPAAPAKLAARCQHWQKRLAYLQDVHVCAGGAEQGWHVGAGLGKSQTAIICVPAATVNWPAGLIDVMLLSQLAQLKQNQWRWLVFGRLVQALYWPAPWVSELLNGLAKHLVEPAERLAASAYRDNEGWARDVRSLAKRTDTLREIPELEANGLLRVPSNGVTWLPPQPSVDNVRVDGLVFEDKWVGTKQRMKDKTRDPYEQAYWLIAVASIVVGVSTTLTVVQRSPEFEPQYLKVKWQDQMVRRLYDDTVPSSENARTGESAASHQ